MDTDFLHIRERQTSKNTFRKLRRNEINRADCQYQAHSPASHGYDQSLYQQLPNQSEATRPERCADGELLAPGRCAYEKEMCRVCARDEQDKTHSTLNHQEG